MPAFVTSCQFEIGSNTYTVKPTFRLISEIEQSLGMGFITLARKIQSSDVGIKDMAMMITLIIKYSDPKTTSHSIEQIGEMIMQKGIVDTLQELVGFFSLALGGDEQ